MSTEAMVFEQHGGPEVLTRKTIDLGAVGAREVRVPGGESPGSVGPAGGPAFKLALPHHWGPTSQVRWRRWGPGFRA
ncbi:MAG: hypothetical protein R3B70_18625 [Polyangiaceae bacterium]